MSANTNEPQTPAGGAGPDAAPRIPGRDDPRELLRRYSDDATAWSDSDPWFDERWSMRRARQRVTGVLAFVGIFAAGLLAHAAWRQLPATPRSIGMSASVLDLSDPTMLEWAGFMKKSYSPLADEGAIASRVAFAQSQHAAKSAAEWLGIVPRAIGPDNPLVTMLGVSQSEMPGGGRSMHYRYAAHRADAADVARAVRVFVQQDDDKLRTLAEGKTYLLINGDTPIRMWRSNGLAYFIVGESRWANNIVSAGLNIPDPTEAIRISRGNLESIGDVAGDGKGS